MGSSRDVADLGDRLRPVPVLFAYGVVMWFWLFVAWLGALWIVFQD